jgi:hypothetical protein
MAPEGEDKKTGKAGKPKASPKATTSKAAGAKVSSAAKTRTPKATEAKAATQAPPKRQAAKTTSPPKSVPKARRGAPSFTLYEPRAMEVFVAGCFNDWNPFATPLQRDDAGMWSCTIELGPGRHEYRFVVDGDWRDDPLNSMRCFNEFGTENCVVVVEE